MDKECQTSDSFLLENVDQLPKFKNLVLSGGSVKGIAQIGAVKRLVDAQLINLKKLKAVAGASAGALFAALIVLGFSIDEIWNFMLSLDLKKLVNPDIFLFIEKCGLDDGNIIQRLYEEIFARKTKIKNINFQELYQITGIHLIIVGSCLTTKESIYYDYINTPTFQVSTAIRISISMPGFFTPISIDNKTYVDGAILNCYPMNLFEHELDQTVGILLCSQYDTSYNCPEQYLMAIINLFMHRYSKEYLYKYQSNTICINETCDLSIFNFNVGIQDKENLYRCGMKSAEEFIRTIKEKSNIKMEEF